MTSDATHRPAPLGPLLAFFLLTFVVTWASFITVALGVVPLRSPLGQAIVLFGTFAPAMVALVVSGWIGGQKGVRALLSRIIPPAIPARWYVFALTYMAAIKLAVAGLHRVATGSWPRFGLEPLYLIPFAIAISTPVQAGEELGWRGFALPRLAERLGFGGAGVLLGAIWAVWHLPVFFMPGADKYGQSFALYLLQVTAISVAMTWLFAHTKGSLLPVMLMHAAVNNTKDIVPSATQGATNTFGLTASAVAWVSTALLWACATYFLIRMPRVTASLGPDIPSGGTP